MRIKHLVILFLVLSLSSPALADKRGERDSLRRAVESGQLLSLEQILSRVENVTGSRIVEIELDDEDGVAVYEIYFLDKRGRRQEIKVRAADAVILEFESDDDHDEKDDD